MSCVRSTPSRNEPSWIRSQPGGSAGRTLRPGSAVPGVRGELGGAAAPGLGAGAVAPRAASSRSSASSSSSSAPTDCSERGERRLDRVLEDRYIRVGRAFGARAIGLGRLRSCIRVPVRLRHGQGRGASGSSAPAPPGEAPPEAPTPPRRCLGSWLQCSASPTRSGAGPSLRQPGLPLGSWRMRFRSERPIPSSTACASGSAPGAVVASSGPVTAHENRSPPTSTAINTTPAFVTMPPGRAPSGGETHCFQRLTGGRPWA